MNDADNTTHQGETLIYDAVCDLTREQVEQTVRKNAVAKKFNLKDEHLDVIHTLVEHYKNDCQTQDCLSAHDQMRFLENAYQAKGGSKYLYMLFDTCPEMRGVLRPIHELAGLPPLRLESDHGFGTSF